MPFPAAALALATAGPVEAVRLADVNGDGTQELVVATRAGAAAGPTALRLAVYDLRDGVLVEGAVVTLPARAAWWDAGHGLWGVDAEGVVELLSGRRVLTRPTGLPSRGAATPQQTALVTDLDQDGGVELLVPGMEAVWVVRPDGALLAEIPAAPAVSLSVTAHAGGAARQVALRPPAVAVADMDGDGHDDVLVVGATHARVHPTTGSGPSPVGRTLALPATLHPAPPGPDSDPSTVTAAHWADLTGDGRADLLLHRLRSDGRLIGTEAEVHLHPNQGGRLGPATITPTGAGGTEAYLVDLDADGYLDVLLPQLSLDAGNLAQAVLRRSVDVRVTVLPGGPAGLGPPESAGELTVPVEDHALAWTLFDDLDGDGRPDLALAVDGVLHIHPVRDRRLAPRPSLTLDLGLPVTNLWVGRLGSGGRPQLVGWTPGAQQVVVVPLP